MSGDENKNATELYVLLAEHKSTYSIDDRLSAVMLYAAEGNLAEVARKTNIPYYTVKDWKECEWWPVALSECRKRKQDELDSMFTNVIHEAIGQASDRIRNGDYYVAKTAPSSEFR